MQALIPRTVLTATLVVLGATLAPVSATAAPTGAATVTTQAATTEAANEAARNLSPNPRLARSRAGWRAGAGARALTRVRVAHRGARHAARVGATRATARVVQPRARLASGRRVSRVAMASDVRPSRGARARMVAVFRDARGRTIRVVRGAARPAPGRVWRTHRAWLAVPARARSVETNVVLTGLRGGRAFVTNHVVRVVGTGQPPPSGGLDNSVTQPGLVAYGSAGHARPYAARGAMVIAGRENYGSQEMRQVSAAGGTVLVYVDPVIDNDYGRYHQLLNARSACGAATQRWPGGWRANEWGDLNDFRPGSAVQRKLRCVLERIVAENPHIGGFFADDVGSRSWFPGFSWDRFGAANRSAYRRGAIAMMRTFREVADRHGLVVIVNGTWEGGSLASKGGGYPNASEHGLSLADGTFAENHTADGYWGREYPCARQWAEASTVTRGKHFNFAVTRSESVRRDFTRTGCYAFAATQQQYDTARVWGPFRRTGLPSRVRGR